jgi:uncharacterized membrane protein YkgB
MMTALKIRVEETERAFGDWASAHGVEILRISLGIVFVWFGVLKFCPGLCDVELLAVKTMRALTFSLVPARICLAMLAAVECGIGVGLIAGRWMRLTTICLLLHLAGTFLPMMLFPGETWKHFPYAPTLVGQYILKNMVLVSAGLVVGAKAFRRTRVLKVVPIRARRVVAARAGVGVAGIS